MFSLEDPNKKCCGKSTTSYFNMQFVVYDEDFSAVQAKLFLCNFDGEGDNFLGLTPQEYLKGGANSDKKIKNLLTKLTDTKNACSILVESVPVGEGQDRIFRIVGNYEVAK